MTGILYKKRNREHRWMQRKGPVRVLLAKERGLRRNQLCPHLDFKLLASRIVNK